MSSLNQVNLIGRLVKDVEKKDLDGDKVVAKMTLAVDNETKEKSASFFNITMWSKLAEVCAANLSKGRLVFVSGRLNNRSWVDSKSGETKYATDVVADKVKFLDSKKKTDVNSADESPAELEPDTEEAPF